ncbi:MAG TPA: sulfotransferase [Terriglobales bacterium]|nr:sulfotransferase [Terriglobales bacterium]
MQNDTSADYKYVFVCGLPRSGTSILGRNIARLENCTGFKDTGVLEDEGRFLQDVYPTEDVCGGPGRFGFDPRAHLTEASGLLTQENVARLRASWHAYWDNSKSIFVEKTPANLLMTRFLQAAFPNSCFVVIRRHPIPVGMAAQKWKVNVTSLDNMFEHWLHCHALFDEDKRYLNHVYELSYEDYIQNQAKHHEEIAAFIGTRVPGPPKEDRFRTVTQWRNPTGLRVPERAMEEATVAHNKKYFDRWYRLLTGSPFKSYYRYIARKYEPRFAEYGYSLTKGFGQTGELQHEINRSSRIIGGALCVGAEISAAMCRGALRCKKWFRLTSKAILPKFVANKIRQARQRAAVSQIRDQRTEDRGQRAEVRSRRSEDGGRPPAHRGLPSGLEDQPAGSGPGGRTDDGGLGGRIRGQKSEVRD